MSTRIVTGRNGAIETEEESSFGERNERIITVEGPYEKLKNANANSFVPSGFHLVNSHVKSTGNGFGRLDVVCEESEFNYDGSGPYRVTYRIDMLEVQKDLKNHPSVIRDRVNIERWLNTEASKRIDADGDPQWVDENGIGHKINEGTGAWLYGDAYMRGIESYVVHYPIIEKISHYRNLPGCQLYQGKVSGGSVTFSKEVDKWGAPEISLSGFASSGWIKTGDSYQQDGGRVWVRTEQWTWTPDGASSPTGWIYSASNK